MAKLVWAALVVVVFFLDMGYWYHPSFTVWADTNIVWSFILPRSAWIVWAQVAIFSLTFIGIRADEHMRDNPRQNDKA